MPIRFRCAYCNQLMGIARRKAGSVVRCPKCSGQVVVPASPDEEPGVPPSPPAAPNRPAGGGVFEEDNFSKVLFQESPSLSPPSIPPREGGTLGSGQHNPETAPTREYDVELIGGAYTGRGIFLTPGLLTLAGVLIILLMGAAFFVGWMIGRA
jgi:phage FluMu protein Com